jgi:putative phosphoesterase
MRYAVLSDIHGNQYALEEVIKEVEKLGISNLLLLGDYVGYYYGIVSILEQIRRFDFVAIRGNHEDLLLGGMNNYDFLKSLNAKYGTSHSRCIEALPKHELDYLTQLPRTCELKLDDLKVLLCHGAPWSTDEYVYPDAGEETLSRYDDYHYNFIFFGHTHYRTVFKRNGMQVINPGSVGQSRHKGGKAFWGIIDTENKVYTQRVTSYDVKKLKSEVLKYDPGKSYNHKVLTR